MKKKIVLILVMVLIVSILAFSLCACDNKDKDDKVGEKAGINFEGMSKEDIVKMADEGKITSFTDVSEWDDVINYYVLSEMGEAILYYNIDGTLISEIYYIYNDDDYYYAIYCYYADYDGDDMEIFDEPQIEYFKAKKDIDDQGINVSEDFKDAIIDGDYTIEGDKLIFDETSLDEGTTSYTYKVNASDWTVPEKFSKYKELAVESEE